MERSRGQPGLGEPLTGPGNRCERRAPLSPLDKAGDATMPFHHKRALPLLAALCVAAAPAPAFAHAVVIHATLQDAPPRPDTPTTVTLRSNAAIEAPLSKVYLLDASGRLLELRTGPSQAPDQLVVELPSLPPGAYGLKYKVLAADGHFTENGLRFRIREKA